MSETCPYHLCPVGTEGSDEETPLCSIIAQLFSQAKTGKASESNPDSIWPKEDWQATFQRHLKTAEEEGCFCFALIFLAERRLLALALAHTPPPPKP